MVNDHNQLLEAMGVTMTDVPNIKLDENWTCYNLSGPKLKDAPIILIKDGPKNIADVKKRTRGYHACVIFSVNLRKLFLKSLEKSYTVSFDGDAEYERISGIIKKHDLSDAQDSFEMTFVISQIIDAIPNTIGEFENRGLFSTHYLRNRLFDDFIPTIHADDLKNTVKDPNKMLSILGWKYDNGIHKTDHAVVIVTEQSDFSTRDKDKDITPSYLAVTKLISNRWVILTNGRKWRLYTNKISASSTNYFEIDIEDLSDRKFLYLTALFGAASFEGNNPKIDMFFEEGKKFAKSLEENLAEKIMSPDGLLIALTKGILKHDMETIFTTSELDIAKQNALKIIYRLWFIAYAESRNLLPARDNQYKPISLQSIGEKLDAYDSEPNKSTCWDDVKRLFKGVRNGSPKHNLPQYDGGLFSEVRAIDDMIIKNKFMTDTMRGLLERDGQSVDYSSLSIRHMGNILETIMEYVVKQADRDIMLLEEGGKIKEVDTKQQSTYSYKKNDLYLASKAGMARKSTASFYTPDTIVSFLVKRGLESVFVGRSEKITSAVKKYEKTHSREDMKECIDLLLDIQVLDPAMGSGHFLVEALNQITLWATKILQDHPKHPLISEIERDRRSILDEQLQKGITLDQNLLTYDVLLKRRIMKRCIFGVDLNPMATELAKMSLWLDSFAIGVPLTYLDHHIKHGDSTIGSRLEELKDSKDQCLDDWFEDQKKSSPILEKIYESADITMNHVRNSKIQHAEYEKQIKPYKYMLDAITALKIDKTIISKIAHKNILGYLKRIADAVSGENNNPDDELKQTISKIEKQSKTYGFFHWELEMLDAFTDKRNGFDLIVGNPPWNKIRPNKKEFFTSIDQAYKEKPNDKQKEIRKKYSKEYEDYKQKINEMRTFYKNHGGIGENTDYEIYRLITERSIKILALDGVLSMVIPSAITNSRGATALRKYFLKKDILSLYVFENKKKIFPIHAGYRFALFTMRNSTETNNFPAGFYLHNLESLVNNTLERDKFSIVSKQDVDDLSPELSLIYQVLNSRSYKIIKELFAHHPRLSDMKDWSVELGRELNIGENKDHKLLVKHGGWPVLESKTFHQHISKFSSPCHYANIGKTLERTNTIKKFFGKTKEIHENPRLVYRSISSSANTRTMIACIIPHSVFTTINTYMAIPRIGIFDIDLDYYRLSVYLCAIFNSTTYDHIIRPIIDKSVETYHIYNTPIPSDFKNEIAVKICRLSTLLALSESWHQELADVFSITKKETKSITLHERIIITAKIDALVSMQYRITRDDYKHILNSFKSNDGEFTNEEMNTITNYDKMQNADKNKHMRKFYNKVYTLALQYYDEFTVQISKKVSKND